MEASSCHTEQQPGRRKRTHRGGKKKKKSRRQSFATGPDDMANDDLSTAGSNFYTNHAAHLSNTSLDSEALLDHRDQQSLRPRRPSIAVTSASPFPSNTQPYSSSTSRLRTVYHGGESNSADEDDHSANEGAPLLSQSMRLGNSEAALGYGSREMTARESTSRSRTSSGMSVDKKKLHLNPLSTSNNSYNVNYPPSMPGSPRMRPVDPVGLINFGDDLLRDEISRSELRSRAESIGDEERPSGRMSSPMERRHTISVPPEEDVCFPQDGMSEMGDDMAHNDSEDVHMGLRSKGRRRKRRWPDLSVLEDWSKLEKEANEERRVKRITEPQLINGRLRPVNKTWFKAEDDAPYRFTYFNEEFQSTVHSQTISGLVQAGGTFRELFVPEPVIIEDSSSESDNDDMTSTIRQPTPGESRAPSRQTSVPPSIHASEHSSRPGYLNRTFSPPTGRDSVMTSAPPISGLETPVPPKSPNSAKKSTTPPEGKPVRFGERPVWWLDVLNPSEAEMRVISKTFGIHPLTAEDIIMQEAREKVELFRHYYFVNYRTFDQDEESEDFLEPVNMYIVVFREGILTFHFSITPHPANVRRRVRQLRDYMMLSADWISYAIIDDITDVFVPLITRIEEEVDDIDDEVLGLQEVSTAEAVKDTTSFKSKDNAMLRRIGDCRKKVMGLYRLLGNKADVIKGFAKRCNEHWEVAPRSDIGLYLGDIQDHIVTMTANLSHYEKILARSHANYLAQISLRMNERQEETADILGKLTILGTIVLPMNLVTGLWGMNVWVPGQAAEGDLTWFFAITVSLLSAGLLCYWLVKKLYGL
ncbi:manganese resistance protein MNR2 [Pyricularia oryzae 70-15]|uniref:Manganese resistance protein MNR2 n=3 Tax=Pyricularia oryzae TaxID=318829 RepID=G4MR33_PYRO7|nr:manganese resistance protein MNR2 [Pyricularia oryzae 70-15]EHA57365.1 manganese resistance protein MNR2 [Pyricularia oryzae 70-15]ELQ36659.1 manganese resistance protein MNR2 [Pyricularia oryzae Y34]KAI7928664.1 manganese resistance protein MNR2 [Pyricularia oryzae]KAI7928730.1 manganese resistance protein MNR2 [Pyricularia oryzae]